ncbi:hypothetical protein LCGC14_0146640 [marine sediment metagenome]|uniref:Putative regulatory protein FmdB zinc ribbon domain-containing protein n=1 Tax=marine sediment metagenome TaxID=412755 RepID=A0A0F9VFI3_9ZZZZ
MARYEYECESGHISEIIQSIADDRPEHIKCHKCGERSKKILSRSNFELKGGGWYKDGYSSESKQQTPKPPKKNPTKKE